jgi:hypothetical protein
MRISLAVLSLVAACGGAQRKDGDGKAITDCAAYDDALRAPLARLARAADRFSDGTHGAPDDAARELSRSLEKERVALEPLAIDEPDLRRAHLRMLSALGEMTRALDTLADVLARHDEARREEARVRLKRANEQWSAAVEALRRVCAA